MVEIKVQYSGDLHCTAVHVPSGVELGTDAPVDNLGKGESFSPTDLVATALGTCVATTMAIVAKRKGLELPQMEVSVEKHMTAEAPRKIARLPVSVRIPLPPDHPDRGLLEGAGRGCPVHRSLHPDIDSPIEFEWRG